MCGREPAGYKKVRPDESGYMIREMMLVRSNQPLKRKINTHTQKSESCTPGADMNTKAEREQKYRKLSPGKSSEPVNSAVVQMTNDLD